METRALTLSFSDVVGSTALALTAADPDGLRRRYTTVLRSAVHRHGGTQVKHLGDGLMAAFPSASAAIAASSAMHRCTAALAERLGVDLQVRVGLAHGDVTDEDGDLFGEPVVVAARLCAAAGPGETLATALVPAVAGRAAVAAAEAVDPLALKGLDAPTPAVRLLAGPAEDPSDHLPPSLRLQRARDLFGRDDVVDAVDAAVLSAVAGDGTAVLIEGEGGLGKTRLAAEAAASVVAVGGMAVYAAVEPGLGDPYAAVAAVTRELARRDPAVAEEVERSRLLLAPLADGQRAAVTTDRRATLDALAQVLAAVSAAPAVVVLDDLHHGGTEAASLFAHLAAGARGTRVLLLGLTRPTPDHVGSPAARIELQPLGAGDVARFAERRRLGAEVVPAVLDATSGHPLLVDETLRALASGEATVTAADGQVRLDGVPPSIDNLVARELDALGPAARDVALVLAVAGADSSADLLEAAVGGTAAAGVASLIAAELVVDRGLGEHRFRHELFRRAVLDVAGPEVVDRTRRRVADGLAAIGAPERVQVWHLLACAERHDVEAVGARALRCIADERSRLAMPVAARLATTLLDRLRELRVDLPGTAARAHGELARLASWAADARAAQSHAGASADHARRCGDADALTEAAIQYTGWVDAGTDDPVAEQLFTEAHGVLDEAAPALQARLLAAEADYWSISRSRPERGRPLAEDARERAERCGDPLAVVDSLWALANAGLGDAVVDERLDIVRRLLAVSGVEPSAHVLAHRLGVHAHLEAGDRPSRDRSAATLRSLGEHDGEGSARLWADVADVEALLRAGHLDDAEAAITAFAASGDDPTRRNIVVAQLFKLSRERGQLAGLLPVLEAAAADAPDLPAFVTARLLALHAAGHVDEARAGLEDLLGDGAGVVPADQSRGAVLLGLAELAADLRAPGPAEVLLDALAERSGTIAVAAQGVFSLGAYDRGIGRLHHVLDRPEEAMQHLHAAARLEGAVGDAPSRRRTLEALSVIEPGPPRPILELHEPPARTGAPP